MALYGKLRAFLDILELKVLARDLTPYLNLTAGMRGVAVFVSATEPTDAEVNDIWIKI